MEDKSLAVFTPEGVVMMLIAIFFDIASIICTILILAFGIGEILAIIVDIIAFIGILGWSSIRSALKERKSSQQSNISLPDRYKQKAAAVEKNLNQAATVAKTEKVGTQTAKASKMTRMAKFAKWGKILTPIKNLVPGLGLIPSWTPTVYFELQS